MLNPGEFIIKAFSLYVVARNLDVILIGIITVLFLYVILKTIQNGFPTQGQDPERNEIVIFTIKGLFVVFFMTFFYLIFHEEVEERLGAVDKWEPISSGRPSSLSLYMEYELEVALRGAAFLEKPSKVNAPDLYHVCS